MDKMDEKSLPRYYDENMVGFFSQGPSVLYVYWELSGSLWDAAEGMGGICIRLYRVFENANSDFEYILDREAGLPPFTNNWYFDNLEPGGMYRFEIGCRLSDGSFFSLMKSEVVSTPPAPKYDIMPKQRPAEGRRDMHRPLENAGVKEGPEIKMDVREVFRSMPFYMGYHKHV
ncbi:MAG: DUF4912 domain-containing protein [Bacillota bacterium]